jgi:putative MATE family efflux protein
MNAAREDVEREPTWSAEPPADFAGLSGSGAASRRLWLLALPVLGQSLLTLVVGWSDTLLAGHLLVGEEYLAAITAATYLHWLIDGFGGLISVGAQAVVARRVGARRLDQANAVLAQALLWAAVLGVGLTAGVWLAADALTSLLHLSDSSRALAAEFLRIVSSSYPLLMVLHVGCYCLQAAGRTLAAMCLMAAVTLANLAGTWLLASGVGPLPALGWTGVAFGTEVALSAGGLLTLAWLRYGSGPLRLPRGLPRPDLGMLRQILRLGVPATANWLGVSMIMLWHLAIVGQLGDRALAAHGVVVRCEALSWLVADAFAVAGAALVGQALGAGRPDLARRYGWMAFRWGMLFMTLLGIVFYAAAGELFALFVPSQGASVRELGVPVLRLAAFAQPALAAATILTWALEGGAGDTRWPLAYSLASMLLVQIPLTYALTGPWLPLGLYGAWLALLIDGCLRGLAASLRFAYGRWAEICI